MKIFNPKVSIVIPVYNGSNFMGEAIDSALAQTYKNIEIIVVNDGSTDGEATEKIAKSYGDKIRYFLKENGGVATALNFGIAKMTGQYFSWLSHDDMYQKTKIEDQISLLKEIDKDVVVACNARVLYPSGIKKNEYIDKDTFEFIDIFLSTSAVTGVNGCSLLIPKKALIENNGFNINLPVTQDYDLWFRIKDKYSFVLLEKNLVISRRHEEQDSVKKQKLDLEAGDKLHYDFLSSVPYERFEAFFVKNKKNLASYWNNYSVYKLSGFKKTASMMLKYILRFYCENDIKKFHEVFESEIGTIVNSTLTGKKKIRKRVMFFNNVWIKGGIEKVLSFMFSHFCSEYDCILVTHDNKMGHRAGSALPEAVSYFKVNNRNQIAELINLLFFLDVDLFVGNPNYSESFIDIYPLLKSTNVKSIAYNHGHYFLSYMCGAIYYPTALKIKEAFGAANHVVWLSQTGCSIYNIENNNGLYIANPAINNTKNKPREVANKNILAVGRFDDELKRIDKTLLVFKELHKIDPDYHLDIVGYCPEDMELPWLNNIKLPDFIDEQQIPVSKIRFWGEQGDVSKFYDDASFLILTSRCEGFALVLVEALSKGVPCAAFEYLGIEEIVQNGSNGWVCQQGDHIRLARSIATSIDDSKQYSTMSQNALSSTKKFDVSVFYEKWKKLIESTLGTSDDKLAVLKPDGKLSSGDYTKIITEYEKWLNVAVTNYMNKETPAADRPLRTRARISSLARRTKLSLRQDGIYLTGEKIIRKVLSKALGGRQ